jgi:DNA-binding CsgD family transcriptional regulator
MSREEALELRAQGVSLRRIADGLGVPLTTVANAIRTSARKVVIQ